MPAVAISGHQRVQGVTNIAVDNKKAAFMALEHLVKLGHKQIAFFKGHPGSADTEYRWKGILQAASSFGIELRPELVMQLQRGAVHPGPSVPEEGYCTGSSCWPPGSVSPHCLPSMIFRPLERWAPSGMLG